MTDLTKITTPFGLLDAETQKALREHGGPYEMFFNEGWRTGAPVWAGACTYRVKPQPPKPREWWMVDLMLRQGVIFKSLEDATEHGWKEDQLIHLREVLE